MRRSKIVILSMLGLLSLITVGCVKPAGFTFFSASLPAAGITTSGTGPVDTEPSGAVAAIEAQIEHSVVAVNAESVVYDGSGNPVINQLAGTGWIFDESGLIVTNNHVVAGATSVTVTMDDGNVYTAKTVKSDSIDDIAVIDIGVGGLQSLTLGDSSLMAVGDCAITVGNALGKNMVASTGVISNTDATFTVDSRETLYGTFEITTPITYGNSGGPLVNMAGQVIGITSGGTLNLEGQELSGYAITSNTAGPIIRDLIDNGYVKQQWLGVTVSNISDIKSQGYSTALESGAYVLQVSAGSPAVECGILPGDVIVSLNGMSVNDTDDLAQIVRDGEIGKPEQIIYWRAGGFNTTSVSLIQNPVS